MTKERDIAFGIHSRIPRCCIDFFVSEWVYIYPRDTAYTSAVNAANWHYVPCPKCLGTGRKANIKWCINECGREHPEDF
jgi:hypothetical protein